MTTTTEKRIVQTKKHDSPVVINYYDDGEFEVICDDPQIKEIVLATIADVMQHPSSPNTLNERVQQLADLVYNLDELVYYLDTPDSDVTMHHVREAALKLHARTIRFIKNLPNE